MASKCFEVHLFGVYSQNVNIETTANRASSNFPSLKEISLLSANVSFNLDGTGAEAGWAS